MEIHFEFWFDDTDGCDCYWRNCNLPGYMYGVLSDWWGIDWANIDDRFATSTNIDIDLPIDQETTFSQLLGMILTEIGTRPEAATDYSSFLYILYGNELIHIDDLTIPVERLWRYIERQDQLNCLFIFSTQQGDVYRDKDLLFYMHPNEQGHNWPHVHVFYGKGKEVSVRISDGYYIVGDIPRGKVHRRMQQILEDNKTLFVNAWNMQTNGMHIDINYGVGIFKARGESL